MNIIMTGCSSGIGASITNMLISQGHCIFNFGRTHITATHDCYVDFENIDSIESAVKSLKNNWPERIIDAIILCAAINDRNEDQWCEAQIERHVKVNAIAPAQLIYSIEKHIGLGFCNIIVLGSYSGIVSSPALTAYSMSKAALHRWAESLAATRDYNVNILLPGRVNTRGNPIKLINDRNKFKNPVEVWPAISFLLSQDENGMNGQILDISRR